MMFSKIFFKPTYEINRYNLYSWSTSDQKRIEQEFKCPLSKFVCNEQPDIACRFGSHLKTSNVADEIKKAYFQSKLDLQKQHVEGTLYAVWDNQKKRFFSIDYLQ